MTPRCSSIHLMVLLFISFGVASGQTPRGDIAALSAGKTKLWLDASRGYAFSGAVLDDRWFSPVTETVYPTFAFVNDKRERVVFPCNDQRVRVKTQKLNPTTLAVHYLIPGAELTVTWSVTDEHITCESRLQEEKGLLLESVGEGRFCELELGPKDYGITMDSFLIRPGKTGETIGDERQSLGNQARLNMVAARVGDRIVYLKPLNYSNVLRIAAVKGQDGDDLVQFGLSCYFRPAGFLDPRTNLVHRELVWRLESAGDANHDGQVDWVDAAIAYRDRHLPNNPHKPMFFRDSYCMFHQTPKGDSYRQLLDASSKLDFATGIYLVKGALTTIGAKEAGVPQERHSYRVERTAMGDKNDIRKELEATGNRFGIYYGGEYFDVSSGDWPEEFLKLGPTGEPLPGHAWYAQQKDFTRASVTGKLKEHWAHVFDTVRVGPGDMVYLDGYNSHSDFSYHPEYPATPQSELAVRRDLSQWLKYERGISVAGEGLIEATVDVDDFALSQYGFFIGGQYCTFWQNDFPKKYVPLFPVVYTGSVYAGDQWYELRNKTPNWAAAMTICARLHTWDSLHYPDHLYEMVARLYFNNIIFWSQIADYRVADFDRDGDQYTIRFEKGSDGDSPVLWTDPPNGRFWLEKNGIRYDGFTPFSTKGVMAILKQGDFDITLPIREDLEILPSQPHREKLDVRITRTPEGFVRVKGNFSKIPWQLPYLTGNGEDEKVTLIDVEPVLLLRKK